MQKLPAGIKKPQRKKDGETSDSNRPRVQQQESLIPLYLRSILSVSGCSRPEPESEGGTERKGNPRTIPLSGARRWGVTLPQQEKIK